MQSLELDFESLTCVLPTPLEVNAIFTASDLTSQQIVTFRRTTKNILKKYVASKSLIGVMVRRIIMS